MAQRLLLSLEEITLSFGGKPLFENLNLFIKERERICLVGKNGAGKTTLMRLMSEALELDAGKRFVLPGIRIGHLMQSVTFDAGQSVKTFVMHGLPCEERREDQEYRADMVIGPLGLNTDAEMTTLSGGQLRRAALAQALVHEPDILLLDEPTNHLDLETIEWLEDYLQYYPGSVLCVSHDRRFLAQISQTVFWLDRGQLITCPVGYAQFDEWLEKRLEQEARELNNLKKKVDAEHQWTQGGVTGRRKRNQRRLRELANLRDKLQKDKAAYRQRSQKISMDALDAPTASKIVAEFKGANKAFRREDGSEQTILHDFHHTIMKGDRLGILGKNGSGKSTFLKCLTGELSLDKGRLFRSKTLQISYFDQHRSALDPSKTLWETLCPDGGQDVFFGPETARKSIHVCGYLKRFLFDPKQAHDKVGTLSGGQQNRLLLARILADPGNLLILDEPTNDLDMDTLDMLQDMLADYDGTLILVSHDRDFLDRSVTELLAFEGDGHIEQVFGGYSDYLRQIKARRQPLRSSSPGPASEKARASDEPISSPALPALTYGETLELEKLPEELETLEQQREHLQTELDDSELFARDPERFQSLIEKYDALARTIREKEVRWINLEERRESGEGAD